MRYRPRAGELVHVDVKKLGRIGRAGLASTAAGARERAGSAEFVEVAVADATRLVYVEVLEDVDGAVGPAVDQGADEALCFAVGCAADRAGCAVAQAERLAGERVHDRPEQAPLSVKTR